MQKKKKKMIFWSNTRMKSQAHFQTAKKMDPLYAKEEDDWKMK